MTAPGLRVAGLRKRLGKATIVDDLTLDVAEGELLVLVGPSGSGKSTLLRLIAGLVPHDAGTIAIGGRDVGALPPDERDIAMVFQSYALFPHLTIFDNLAFGLRARGEPKDGMRERIAAVAGSLGLASLLDRYPRQLSGGERQRVALGRALLRAPRLFLMDEPLSNLDAQLRVQTRAEILRLHERLRTTTIYVTHDQIEALGMGDRIGVLRDGRLEQVGPPQEVYARPRNLFVARFIGSPPMNALDVVAAPPRHVRRQRLDVLVPEPLQHAIGDAGRALVLGVRPEHVYLHGSRWAVGAARDDAFAATVDVVESAGDQQFLLLDVDGTSLTVRAEPDFRVKRGDRVRAWFDDHALHLFDPATGVALAHSDGA